MSNINNNSSSVPKSLKSNNKLMKNINSNIKQLNPEDYKFFFKRYYLYKNGNKPKEESETDSTYDDLPENNYINKIIMKINFYKLINPKNVKYKKYFFISAKRFQINQ